MSKKVNREEIVDFKEVFKPFGAEHNLRDFLDKEIIIKDVVWQKTQKYGEIPILTIEYEDENGNKWETTAITFSRVIIRQLKDYINELIIEGKKVKVRVCQKKNYLTLC